MSYTPKDTGHFVRGAGKGSNEGPRGMKWRSNYNPKWHTNASPDEGFKQVSPKRIRKTYKLL